MTRERNPRGGDRVKVDGKPAVIVRMEYTADKKSGAPRGQRRWVVRFLDGTIQHVSLSKIVRD